ncbi:MAG TPA: beta-ketoacyl synthase N-terminal-like domain-containing protein, partial [Longimicrobium sp.]|nr:beta-ketoacyl synthase N-terminal-like domain-containing protein [Longimicrobium sp.]
HLRARLPAHLLPGAFVALDALPLSPSGKIDRRLLPDPAPATGGTGEGHAPPRTPTERAIAEAWSEVLGVDAVGAADNFFALGGHSLLMIRAHGRLQERLGRRIPMLELFQHRTVADLARHLDAGGATPGDAPAPAAEAAPSSAEGAAPPPAGGHEPVAVIGLAARFPGASGVDAFWRNLREGISGIRRFTDHELRAAGVPPGQVADASLVRAYGALDGIDQFDAGFFGFSPREAAVLNPQHRLFLETAWEALEGAGYDPARAGGRVGVFTGAELNGYWTHAASHPSLAQGAGAMTIEVGNDSDFVPTRVSFALGLEGPSLNVQTACSSSLVAVHLACQSLRAGECEMALAGGASVRVPHAGVAACPDGGPLSPAGECRAYDAGARGTVGGSGVGAVLLKPLPRALADGDTVHAVILGSAVNNDGARKAGYTAPGRDGQARVIADALRAAAVPAATIGYLEGHGSGTALGDPIEVAALTQAFRAEGADQNGFCALGSVKTAIGHLDAAAGIAGLIKTVLALRHSQIPPSLNFQRPNPAIDFAGTPFRVNAARADWPRGATPRRAGVSAFGIGGTNAHVVLEEAPPHPCPRAEAPEAPGRGHLLLLSARSAGALDVAAGRLARHLRGTPEQDLADVAHTLQVGRRRFAHRRALVCAGRDEAAAALETCDPRVTVESVEEREGRPVAFLFPGLGDQHAGMARGLYQDFPRFRAEVDRCAGILGPRLGLDLREAILRSSPIDGGRPDAAPGTIDLRALLGRGGGDGDDPLAGTVLSHVALFVVEYALAQTWIGMGVRPAAMIGHSLGEYVAACVAEVFSLEDALALVTERARLVEALPPGAMLAVPLPPAELEPMLGGGVALAAVNAPALCTVSGDRDAIAVFARELAARGVVSRPLRAAHAFHSPAMEPVARALADAVRRMAPRAPAIPFVSGVTGTWITAAQAADPAYWASHLLHPVRFAEGVAELARGGERILLETGPGAALASFALQSGAHPGSVFASLAPGHAGGGDAGGLLRALGRLWTAGAGVDWAAYHQGARRRVPLPTYPFERRRHWIDPAPRPRAAADDDGRRTGRRLRVRLGPRPRGAPPAAVDVRSPVRDDVPRAGPPGRPAGAAPRAAPATAAERRLADAWEEVLGVADVGVHDDFFLLGGHSLLGMQLLTRIRAGFGAALTLADLFAHPTVASLAERLSGAAEGDAPDRPPLVAVPRAEGEGAPLSFGQERFWALARMEPDSPFYTVPAAQHLDGPLDAGALERALRWLMRRHHVLRTHYREEDGRPVQVLGPVPARPLLCVELSHLAAGARDAEALRLAQVETRTPLELERGVLRATLY